MCFCSTSLRTTSMQNPSTGSNSTCSNTKERWLPWPTTAISSTMWLVGFSNSTVAKEFLGKATTAVGWSRRHNDWQWRRKRKASAARHCNASWNGCAWLRRHVKPRVRHVWTVTTSSSTKQWRRKRRNSKSSFRMVRDSATRWLRRSTWQRHLATSCSSTTSTSCCLQTASWAWLVRTAQARQRFSDSSWDWKSLIAAPSKWARPWNLPMWISSTRASTQTRACMTWFREETNSSAWGDATSTHVPTSPASTSRAWISRNSAECCRVVSATVCSWHSHSRKRAMCSCSTSQPTTSTWIRSVHSRKVWTTLQVVPLSSATTVGSSTASAPTSLLSRVIPTCSSSKVPTQNMRKTNSNASDARNLQE